MIALRKKRPGFSLIELLVVVAIIVVLLALLFPAMKGARRLANKTACASHLQQMGVGMTAYVTDNEGRYPAHRSPGGVGTTTWNWHDKIAPYIGMGYEVFKCPSKTIWKSTSVAGKTYPVIYGNSKNYLGDPDLNMPIHRIPYGYNGFYLGLSPYPPSAGANKSGRNYTLFGDIARTDKQIIIADSKLKSPADHWSSSIWYPLRLRNSEGVSDVHSGKANILFADGHVRDHYHYLINQHPDYDDWWYPGTNSPHL